MKNIIRFSITNKVAIWILTILAIVAGTYAGLNMKQESMPDITLPNVSVMTVYPGAAPDEIAEKITEPIEQRVSNIEGVKLVTSTSLENVSSVQIEFDFKKDMDKAVTEVNSALETLTLPSNVQHPTVSRMSFNAFPVIALSVTEKDATLEQLTARVQQSVAPVLEGIEGVADVQISGQQVHEVQITFDEDKLQQAGLTEEVASQLIQASNVVFPLGLTNLDGTMKNVVIDGKVTSIDDLKNLDLLAIPPTAGAQGGMPMEGQMPDGMAPQLPTSLPTVKLADIAKVELVSEAESISRKDGQDSIGVLIVKAPDANTVTVVNAVKDMMKELEKDYGVVISSTFDQGEPIEEAVSTMLNKALFGALFAIIIILLFLRSFKTTIISVVSIPLSLLMSLMLLNWMDITLNIMTLGALTVAIGRVIDDSIVVVENIYRRMRLEQEQLRGKQLVIEATREMFIPISSSTIVTIAVFLPLGLVSGQVGELFLPFALAVVFALLASLLVAVTIVPLLAHSLFQKELYRTEKMKWKLEEKPSKLASAYKRALRWTLNHKWITSGIATVMLIASLFLIPVIGITFLPEDEQKMVMATYKPEAGQPIEDVVAVAEMAESILQDREGVTSYQYSIEKNASGMSMMMGGGGNSALFFIEYDEDFEDFTEDSKELMEKLNDQTTKGEWGTLDFASFGSGFELYVYGDDIKSITDASNQIVKSLAENDQLENVESDLSEAFDQYTFLANQEKLSSLGLTAAQIGMSLSNLDNGAALTTVKVNGEDVEVFIATEKEEATTFEELKKTKIPTQLGTTVELQDVMDIEEGEAPTTIHRRDGKMYTSITADILSKDTAAVSNDAQKKIEELSLPTGVTVEFGGITQQTNESFAQLGLAMLAAIAIVYFVLVVTFGGALAPFAILFCLPFTVIGSLVALWIAGEPLGVSGMIGALMLIGIVVTNAIVLIDRVIRQEETGLSTREAILEAGSTRLRPILMTAIATIGALIPLAIGAEGGGLISKGLGVTVIGGLASSTILTLFIVPIVYEVLAKFRRKKMIED